KQKKVC
ncbi:2-succinylbenzoate--CoA ligase, partial [Haemophilus influenzae]